MSEEMMLSYKNSLLNYCDRQTYVKMVVCGILGYDENHMYHQQIGEFYDNYLKEHDLVTAIKEFFISRRVENLLNEMTSEEQKIFADNLIVYIQNIVACYKNEKYEDAAYMFKYMNNFLQRTVKSTGNFVIESQLDELEEYNQTNVLRKVM